MKNKTKQKLFKKLCVIVVQAYHPSTLEVEAGGSMQVRGRLERLPQNTNIKNNQQASEVSQSGAPKKSEPGMMTHACNPRAAGTEARG